LTGGDWHQSALQWEHPTIQESEGSFFGDYGIEHGVRIPKHQETYSAANHIRAMLDMLENGQFGLAQGMNKDFIGNDDYTAEVFEKVISMKSLPNWPEIDRFMGREYLGRWLDFNPGKITVMSDDWSEESKLKHKQVMSEFLEHMKSKTGNFVLTGGAALVFCYGLDRFSENIDLDSQNGKTKTLLGLVEDFCADHDYQFHIAKDADFVQQYMVNYGNAEKPLKIGASSRQREIEDEFTTVINGIRVYDISKLCGMKWFSYASRDRLRDLYDVAFIYNHYFEQLSPETVSSLCLSIPYKGIDYFDYLLRTQDDRLIDKDRLTDDFLKMFNHLGFRLDENERQLISRRASAKPLTDRPKEFPQELLEWFKGMDEGCKRMATDESFREQIGKKVF
jgi:hypothetical protein